MLNAKLMNAAILGYAANVTLEMDLLAFPGHFDVEQAGVFGLISELATDVLLEAVPVEEFWGGWSCQSFPNEKVCRCTTRFAEACGRPGGFTGYGRARFS